jgi:hypothetical protein
MGSGNWQCDLEAYVEQIGPAALDDLFILGGEVSDNIWADLMPSLMFSLLARKRGPKGEENQEEQDEPAIQDDPEDREEENLRRLRNAADDAIGRVMIESRAALTRAIACPREGVTIPVCVGYCRTIARNRRVREAMQDGKKKQFADGQLPQPAVGQSLTGAFSYQQGTTASAQAIAWFEEMTLETQRTIAERAWGHLTPKDRRALWLSNDFQRFKKGAEFLKDLRSPLPDVNVDHEITGEQAAEILGIESNTFYQRVRRAKKKFRARLIEEILNIQRKRGGKNEPNRRVLQSFA